MYNIIRVSRIIRTISHIKSQASPQNIIKDIKQKYNLTETQLLKLLTQGTITKYLKENKNLKHSKIAKKLNRNTKTI